MLYNFQGGADDPVCITDANGALYGTTNDAGGGGFQWRLWHCVSVDAPGQGRWRLDTNRPIHLHRRWRRVQSPVA